MTRQGRWLGLVSISLSGWLLAGCASLPDYAEPRETLSTNLSEPAPVRVVRQQMADGPAVILQKPTVPPPDAANSPPIGSGTVQTSYANRGTVRIRVRAWVNGRPIFDDEVMQAMYSEEYVRVRRMPEPEQSEEMAKLMNNTLDHLIDQELMYQDAVKKLEKINPRALDKMKEEVDKDLDKKVRRMREGNVPEDEIRRHEPIARRLMERNTISAIYARSRIIQNVQSLITLTQIREHYEANLNQFQAVDKVVWQDIFIPVSQNLPTVEDAKRFAEDLINKCRTPNEFNRLMVYDERKIRNCEGIGNLRGEIKPAEVEDALFKVPEGQIGPVIAISTGVHLIRVTKREFKGQLPLNDETQKIIRRKLENQLMEKEYKRIARELRQRAVWWIEAPETSTLSPGLSPVGKGG